MDARSRQRYEKLRLIGGRDPYRRRLEGCHGPMASAVHPDQEESGVNELEQWPPTPQRVVPYFTEHTPIATPTS